MGTEAARPSVGFTPEAERTLQERTNAFAEELRLAAIDEAVRSRGTASEVTASDVLRAAASALERETLKAYEKKLDAALKMFETQALRGQESAKELADLVSHEVQRLAGTFGISKEREQQLQQLYQKLQEQNYASVAELRGLLTHELRYLRSALEVQGREESRPLLQSERIAWLYVLSGCLLGVAGVVGALLRTALRDPLTRVPAMVGMTGLMIAVAGAFILILKRIRLLH